MAQELTTMRVRGTSRPNYNTGSDSAVAIERGGEAIITPGLPEMYCRTRLGLVWSCAIPTASAFTYVAAWPTTRAEIVFRNASANKVAVFENAWMVDLTSAAAAHSKALLAQHVPAHAAVTDDTTALINSRNGMTYTRGSVVHVDLALTTMIANKWELIAATVTANTATIGTGVMADLKGGWIINPGDAIGFAGVASTAAATAIIGASWSEYDA